ncbi:hypothetical protein R3P38DRAFT_2927621 [Favolaschia claudopus]|uniref:Uncharacterized protein n=1 Tax=Favolaschia claudopus TaxID=2862362 RepID=A0AAW0BWR5_9AGAR
MAFPSQFSEAVERQALTRTMDLVAFSICRPKSASSLNDWPVVHLDLKICAGPGLGALRLASVLAPQMSSLTVRMSPLQRTSILFDELISSCCLFLSLQRLELHNIYMHLVHEGESPWLVPAVSDNDQPVSNCVIALSALRLLATRLAQRAPSLDVIHITDEGWDDCDNIWKLEATYKVGLHGDIVLQGTPKFIMARAFRPSEGTARLLGMTPDNTEYD